MIRLLEYLKQEGWETRHHMALAGLVLWFCAPFLGAIRESAANYAFGIGTLFVLVAIAATAIVKDDDDGPKDEGRDDQRFVHPEDPDKRPYQGHA